MSKTYDEGVTNALEETWTCVLNAAVETHSDYTISKKGSVFGGQDDLLGLSDITLLNSPDFGVAFSVTAGSNGAVVAIDAVRVKAFYVDDITAGVKSVNRPDSFSSVAYGESNVIIIVGMKGVITRSTDAGQTWVEVASGVVADLFKIIQTPSGFMVVGDRGTLLQSTDNGATWTILASGTLSELRSIVYNGLNRAVAIASDGVVLHSKNYITWSARR